MLTEEEAVEIRNDPRVLGCEITFKDSGIIEVGYDWTQTADFNKTTGTFSGDDKNWGLYRTVKGETLYDSAAYNITVTASGSFQTILYLVMIEMVVFLEVILQLHSM